MAAVLTTSPPTAPLEARQPAAMGRASISIIKNLLTPEECRELIALSEQQGYHPALVNVGGGRQRRIDDYRSSSRCIIDSRTAAGLLFERVRPWVPEHGPKGGWTRCAGLNERLRFLRYDPGDFFRPHRDGRYVRPADEEDGGDTSLITLMLYLNTPERGGDTVFLSCDGSSDTAIAPTAGLCLLFDHDLLHEGALLQSGQKYCIRTDVMFSRRATPAPPPSAPPRVLHPASRSACLDEYGAFHF